MATPRYTLKKVGDQFVPIAQAPASSGYAVGGGALVLAGLVKRGIVGTAMVAAGAALVYRGITGQNPLVCLNDAARPKGAGGPSYQNDHAGRSAQQPRDVVDEQSMQSFPASDPPARQRSSAAVK